MAALLTERKYLPNEGGRLVNGRRLVVVVPNQEVDEVHFSRAIHGLAASSALDVLLLTAVHDQDSELAMRRQLATIALLARDWGYMVETQVVWSRSWLGALKDHARPGDLVLCPPEMTIRTGLRTRQPLQAAIGERLGLEVRPLPGFYKPDAGARVRRALFQLASWAAILVVLGVFFVLDVDVSQLAAGGLGHVLMALMLLLELGALYFVLGVVG